VPTFSIGSLKTKDLAWSLQPYCERQAKTGAASKKIQPAKPWVEVA